MSKITTIANKIKACGTKIKSALKSLWEALTAPDDEHDTLTYRQTKYIKALKKYKYGKYFDEDDF